MARIILSTVSWAECTEIEFNSLIQNFNEFVHNAPLNEITLPTQTANMTIINRYLTKPINASYTPIEISKRKWESNDDSFIAQYLLNNNEELLYTIYHQTRTINAIRARINLVKKNLDKRPWNINEFILLDTLIQAKIPPKEYTKHFIYRSFNSILQMIQSRYGMIPLS